MTLVYSVLNKPRLKVHLHRVSVLHLRLMYQYYSEQECIPVGCVPPTCCPYLPVCTAPGCPGGGVTCPGGVPAQGGVPALGGVPARRDVYLPGGCTCPGVYLPGGVPAGGVPARGGVPAQVLPPCERNDRHVQKYYLAPNFIWPVINCSIWVLFV